MVGSTPAFRRVLSEGASSDEMRFYSHLRPPEVFRWLYYRTPVGSIMSDAVGTLLAGPRRYFEGRRGDCNAFRGAVVILGLSALTTALLGASLWGLAQQFTGTVRVDNPERPPEPFCESPTSSMLSESGCDQPATIERPATDVVWEQALDLLGPLFVGLVFFYLAFAVGLYVAARVFGGDGRFGATVEVAAVGSLPSAVGTAASFVLLLFFASRLDLSGDPAVLERQIQTLQQGLSNVLFRGVNLLVLAWSASILADGLGVVHDLDRPAAVGIAVLAAALPFLATL